MEEIRNENELALKALKQLVLDEEFEKLQYLSSAELNLMSILRVERKELQHSNFLAWLLDPQETHGLGDWFLKEFIKLYFISNDYDDLGLESPLSVYDFVTMDLSDIQIKREHKNIDLFINSPKNRLVIVIENKIFSKEGKDQLEKYRQHIITTYENYRHRIFIYLSLYQQEISAEGKKHYIQLTYDHIIEILESLHNNHNI